MAAQKLQVFRTIFILLTVASMEVFQKEKSLDQVSCICKLVLFLIDTNQAKIIALINFKSKINVINSVFIAK